MGSVTWRTRRFQAAWPSKKSDDAGYGRRARTLLVWTGMTITPRRLFLAFAAGCGVFLGFAVYTFVYARGYSYLTDDPRACANCHVMNDQYAGWVKAPHRSVAVCNDCHTPA